MKRIGLSLGLPVLGLLLGVATPSTASAQGWRGGGHAAPAAHASGGWHGAAVTRPAVVPHVAVGARGYAGRPAYGVRPGFVARPGYIGRPAYGYGVGPVAGHWGWRGGTRVWFGVATVSPYAGWIWMPGAWAWDGNQWVWQDGYWAPPTY
jgi:YXWGXW repeat-containing protein